jgi:hypothetical protein
VNENDQLARLFAAERAEEPSPTGVAERWKNVADALQADLPALSIAHGPLKLGLSLATKTFVGSLAVGFGVATSGLALYVNLQGTSVAPAQSPIARPPAALPTAIVVALPSANVAVERRPEPVARPAAAARPSASVEQPSTLGEELQLIKAAKRELDAGRAHLASVWLDQHAQRFPEGVFRVEREGLTALIACQQAPGAGLEAARRFLAQNPGSPLVDRIVRACQLDAPPPAQENFPAAPGQNEK